jgi:hypothetical protein
MAIQSLYPSIAPSLNLNFAGTKTLDPRITFARASEGRFWDGKTFAKAEENLLIRSQDFNVGGWSATACTITGDSLAAPDGTTTAELLTSTVEGTSGISQSITTGAVAHTFSVFAKAGTSIWLRMISVGGTNNAWFNLSNGTIGTVQGSTTATISDAGNGWYRCAVTSSVGGPTVFIRLASADASLTAANGSTLYVWGAQLEQRSSVTAYTPTTTAPITNYIPVLQTAAANVARFDHDPVTGESLGLLIEEARSNLLLRSAEFENASWSKTNSTILPAAAVAPDGTLTAGKHIPNAGALIGTGASATRVYQSPSLVSGTAYTLSFYAKAAEYDQFQISVITSPTLTASYSLTAGTVLSGTGATITPVGNGWHRCSVPFTADITGALQIRFSAFWSVGSTGDGYSGIFIWGAQLEAGAFPTSHIPTQASQVTRQVDAASMTGSNFSSWYRQDEGTLYAEASSANNTGTFLRVAAISDGTTSVNVIYLSRSAGTARAFVVANSVSQFTSTQSSWSGAGRYAIAYKTNDVASVFNGGTAATGASAIIPAMSQMNIGTSSATTTVISGHIRSIRYWPTRISNTALQALTS